MARKKAWTKKKRQKAARRGVRTRRKRQHMIAQARQNPNTGYALLLPFGTWLHHSIKLKQRIAERVSLRKGKNSTFSVADVLTGLVLALQAGITHLSHLDKLALEVRLAESIGLPHFFGETTAGDVLRRCVGGHVLQMRRLLWRLVHERVAAADSIEIEIMGDVTSHLSDSYQREHVAYGYCNGPRKPCLKSGRVVINGLPIYVAVFPGHLNPQTPFDKALAMARLFSRLYPQRIIHVSFDSGFASEAHRRRLMALARRYENFRFTFSVAIPNPHSVAAAVVAQAKAKSRKTWRRANARTRVVEMNWRHLYEDSDSKTRVIVVESTEKPRPQPPPKRKRPKRSRSPIRYYLIATNHSQSERKAKHVFKRHHRRAAVELSIKDSKQSYHLDHLPHEKFQANQMFLLLATLAQVLGVLYNQQVLPKKQAGSLIVTVRTDLWCRPGQVINATHIVIAPVYRRLTLVRRMCRAIGLHFGISIVMMGFDSS